MKRRLVTLVLVVSAATAAPLSAQWLDLKTPGIPRTADGAPNLSAPLPRTADGRPELTGLWRGAGSRGDLRDASKVQTWARSAMAEHEQNFYKDGPHMQCLPQGPGYATGSAGGGGNIRRIVQSPTVIAILNPDLTYRQIFTDGRALEEDPLPIWMGYSVGRWDGDTLVVETTNFSDRTSFRGSDAELRLVERFRRVDAKTLDYQFTVDNPSVFSRTWTVSLPMTASDGRIYEYACHEANYAMTGILRGARAQEKER